MQSSIYSARVDAHYNVVFDRVDAHYNVIFDRVDAHYNIVDAYMYTLLFDRAEGHSFWIQLKIAMFVKRVE